MDYAIKKLDNKIKVLEKLMLSAKSATEAIYLEDEIRAIQYVKKLLLEQI